MSDLQKTADLLRKAVEELERMGQSTATGGQSSSTGVRHITTAPSSALVPNPAILPRGLQTGSF